MACRARLAVLITAGLYAILRRPIFLGVHLGQVGLFFVGPNIFTLVCLVVGVGVIQPQARVEEARMARAFGPAFACDKRHVGGFAPGRWAAKRGDIAIAD
jgi:protein-S-isoprenylcysteine O-methyltransferase Ste14